MQIFQNYSFEDLESHDVSQLTQITDDMIVEWFQDVTLLWTIRDVTYVVARHQHSLQIGIHVVVIQCHEQRIQQNANNYKEHGERIEDYVEHAALEFGQAARI